MTNKQEKNTKIHIREDFNSQFLVSTPLFPLEVHFDKILRK